MFDANINIKNCMSESVRFIIQIAIYDRKRGNAVFLRKDLILVQRLQNVILNTKENIKVIKKIKKKLSMSLSKEWGQ